MNEEEDFKIMIRKDVVVHLDSRMETRPVALLVQIASSFDSEVHLEAENRKVNAKSIMGMMTLGLEDGLDVTITANGEDEADAVEKVAEYLTHGRASE